ncbi:hypothetical protein N7G274_005189 [Stereocaulon virgatum]|uniref:Uncharacterized protein n=1 Tax=Stereocaulon virgatum TaxID=373712 RepID=A0ABR4AAU1_9LECA
MFVQCLTSLWVTYLSRYAFSAPASLSGTALTFFTPELSALNVSNPSRQWLSNAFPIPNSHVTLVFKMGRPLNHAPVTALLLEASTNVKEMIKKKSGFAHPDKMPISYSSAEGAELQIYNSGETDLGMTWGGLGNVVRGLWLYLVKGERYESCHFDIFVATTTSIYIHVGWGNLVEPNAPQRKSRHISRRSSTFLSTRVVSSGISNPALRNSSLLHANSLNLTLPPFRFRVPNTEMTLSINIRSDAINFEDVQSLLAKANTRIQFEIVIHGADTSMPDESFRYHLKGTTIYLELISWKRPPHAMTWRQVAEAVEGLALFYFASHSEGCSFDIFYGPNDVNIGIGQIAKHEELS